MTRFDAKQGAAVAPADQEVLFGLGSDVVCRQKALNKHSQKSATEGAGEYKKTNVDWIHRS
jgi:hypothetical protein